MRNPTEGQLLVKAGEQMLAYEAEIESLKQRIKELEGALGEIRDTGGPWSSKLAARALEVE